MFFTLFLLLYLEVGAGSGQKRPESTKDWWDCSFKRGNIERTTIVCLRLSRSWKPPPHGSTNISYRPGGVGSTQLRQFLRSPIYTVTTRFHNTHPVAWSVIRIREIIIVLSTTKNNTLRFWVMSTKKQKNIEFSSNK